jgi:hypothetical protein
VAHSMVQWHGMLSAVKRTKVSFTREYLIRLSFRATEMLNQGKTDEMADCRKLHTFFVLCIVARYSVCIQRTTRCNKRLGKDVVYTVCLVERKCLYSHKTHKCQVIH